VIEYERYIPDVLSEVDNCPEIVVVEKIRDAVIDLCQATTVWRTELLPFVVSINVAEYPLIFDTGQQLSMVNYVTLIDANGNQLDLVDTSEDHLDAQYRLQGWRTMTGAPAFFYMSNPETLRLVKIPEAAYTAYVGVVLKPTPDSYEAPDFIYNQYHDKVAQGAISKLLDMKGRPWYDPNKALLEKQKFYDSIQTIRNAATRSHTRAQRSVAMRPMA